MMEIDDDRLRALVRDVIERRRLVPDALPQAAAVGPHASAWLLRLPSGDAGGACLIEPAVRCTHCGYCQSYGH
jgi:hypothetical protein